MSMAATGNSVVARTRSLWNSFAADREKVDPGGFAHVSCEVKLGRPSKSLGPKRLVFPDCGLNVNDRPERVVPEGSVLVSVIVCAVGADPTCCAGKVSDAGDKRMG